MQMNDGIQCHCLLLVQFRVIPKRHSTIAKYSRQIRSDIENRVRYTQQDISSYGRAFSLRFSDQLVVADYAIWCHIFVIHDSSNGLFPGCTKALPKLDLSYMNLSQTRMV